jgi:hypothetical protein
MAAMPLANQGCAVHAVTCGALPASWTTVISPA